MASPELSIAEAIEAFEVSRATLRRRLADDALEGAHQDDASRWLIPVEALHAAGFKARKTWITSEAQGEPAAGSRMAGIPGMPGIPGADDWLTERAQLLAELAQERAQREAAERIAEDRLRNIDSLSVAIRAIEAARPATPAASAPAAQQTPDPPQRRRLFGRR